LHYTSALAPAALFCLKELKADQWDDFFFLTYDI
jgi:hypothetical protein